jgi:hypothetical protein
MSINFVQMHLITRVPPKDALPGPPCLALSLSLSLALSRSRSRSTQRHRTDASLSFKLPIIIFCSNSANGFVKRKRTLVHLIYKAADKVYLLAK